MKDQLKKTLHDASRHVPIKNEEIIRTDDTLITKTLAKWQLNTNTAQIIVKQDYNPFRTDSQQSYENETNTYYNKGN